MDFIVIYDLLVPCLWRHDNGVLGVIWALGIFQDILASCIEAIVSNSPCVNE
jgi:hypothetical protein